MRWDGQDIAVKVDALPGLARLSNLVRSVQTPEFAGITFHEVLAKSALNKVPAGGPMPFGPPDWPAAANLTRHDGGLAGWSFSDFEKALTAGQSKDGRALRAPMSEVVPTTRAMTTTERQALWAYLGSISPQPTNN